MPYEMTIIEVRIIASYYARYIGLRFKLRSKCPKKRRL